MENPSSQSFTGDGSTRIFPVSADIQGANYIKIDIDGVDFLDTTKFDIINNSVVFTTDSIPANGAIIQIAVAQSVEAIGNLGNITNIDKVADDIDNINTVADNITNINTVAGNDANITTVAGNDANITDIANQVIPNLTEILQADDNATIATNKANEASASASNLPNATTAGASKYITTNATADGWLYLTPAEVLTAIGAEPADATILKDADIGTTVQAYDTTILKDADIGTTVQAYDTDTVKKDVSNTFTAPQRINVSTNNSGNFNGNTSNKFKCTPTGNITIRISGGSNGQGGTIKLDNSGGHLISFYVDYHKVQDGLATLLSTAGVYYLGYEYDGSNYYIWHSGALA